MQLTNVQHTEVVKVSPFSSGQASGETFLGQPAGNLAHPHSWLGETLRGETFKQTKSKQDGGARNNAGAETEIVAVAVKNLFW